MKKTILLGAIVAVIIASAFVYTHSAPAVSHVVRVNVTSNETVIEAMRALASTTAFTFVGHDYPGLGFFVDSINGTPNANGKYWILYVNGVPATKGVSIATVRVGDTVEWKYEKGY